ncbi:Membrane-spanning 4-domains subfamily A member 8A-like [Scleropages formosus]|uniref:Membrane-spanning 4-domains subfamily A member 8A-like n=1 Tax=Scleropages formosus TaxID=113540 RepID=A0A0P7VQL8_SCLFO|nr:Membrane-spanning 4-domains subfamily A member 8A-like [Scleropages formosus]
MAMSMTKGEDVTIITLKSDPKSNCPLVCQLLGTLCYSPVCNVSQRLRTLLGGYQSVLATLQIMLGVFTVSLGAVTCRSYYWTYLSSGVPFWLGGTFIAVGVLGVFAEKFPSSFLVFLNAFASLASSALAVAAIVLYSLDLAVGQGLSHFCQWSKEERNSGYWITTFPPEVDSMKEKEWKTELELCKNEKYIVMMMLGGIKILLIVLAVVHLCVAISTSVLTVKALYRNCRNGKKNCELQKPLLEDISNNLDA